jgi:iron complex outermembrane receptor protein
MIRSRNFLTMATLLFCAGQMAFAGAGSDTVRTYVLDPVTVTGTNLEALRSSVPNAVSVVSREDIRRSGETSLLAVINKMVPGLFLTERGVLGYGVSTGAAGGVSVRGTGGSPNTAVLVLTDGRPQMMGLMGHPLPDTYVSAGVERVEVIRGPASIIHGTNAMGGVINIITQRTPAGGVGVDIAASAGTYGTRKIEGGVGFGSDAAGISILGSRYETGGHRSYSSFDINGGSLRGHYRLSPAFTVSGDASVSGFKTFDPGGASAPKTDNWVDILRGSSGVALENRSGRLAGAVKAYVNFGRHDIYDGFHSTDNGVGVLVYQCFTLDGGTQITAGLDYKRYGGVAENRTTKLDYGEHFVTEYGTYILLQQPLWERITLNGGLRLNHGSMYGDVLIPQAGVAYRLDDMTTLKGSAGRGFRSPTIREMFLFPAPNPLLEPESMWNYEVSCLRSFGPFTSLELTAFQSEGANMIRTEGRFPNLRLTNSGRFIHRGIELAGSVGLPSDFNLEATYSYLASGAQTMASPRHKVFAELQYTHRSLTANLSVQSIAGLYGADNATRALTDFTTLSARVTYAIAEGLEVHVAGENLADVPYQTMWDYPMPGRTVQAGVRWGMR